MEHAGLAVAREARRLCPTPAGIIVLCGTGCNGGDGLAAARHLADWGYRPRLVLTGRIDDLRDEPAVYARILQALRLPMCEAADLRTVLRKRSWIRDAAVLIDALLGIGARGAVREPAASLIAWMNRSAKPIVAVDVPSGLDADTGQVQGVAVRATSTVTFGLPKRGCVLREGPAHAGSLVVDSITIPHQLLRTTQGA